MTVIRACSNRLRTSIPRAVSLRTILDSLDRRPTRRGASLAPGGPWHDEWTGRCETGLNRNWSGRVAPGCYCRNPPSTTRVRSQSPAGSGPLRATWPPAGSRRNRPCASVSAALGASAFSSKTDRCTIGRVTIQRIDYYARGVRQIRVGCAAATMPPKWFPRLRRTTPADFHQLSA